MDAGTPTKASPRRRRRIPPWHGAAIAPVLIGLLAAVAGCGRRAGDVAQASTGKPGAVVLHIAYGKGSNYDILRHRGTLEKRLAPQGVKVEWLNFPMGPQMMQGIGAGSVDIGSCAATPPLFAQAAGVPFVYVGNSPAGKKGRSGGGIILPKGSPIHSIADLRGKRIAFQPGSVWQYYLVKLLERANLHYQDIQPCKLPPADAIAAFESGSIDAWVQGEPYITLVQRKTGARVLCDTSGIETSGGFLLASTSMVKSHPDLIYAALDEGRRTGEWARQHPQEAADLVASTVGLDTPTMVKQISQRNNTMLQPIDKKVIELQQEQADLFERIGVLPKHIDVRQDVIAPEVFAHLVPRELIRSAPHGDPATNKKEG